VWAGYCGQCRKVTLAEIRASTGTSDGFTFLGINYAQTANLRADLDAEIQSVRGAVVLQLGQP
jgi:hypothetical protein